MSEERRKRQEDRFASAESRSILLRKVLIIAAVVFVFAGGYYAANHRRNAAYDTFAQCIAGKQARMYGLFWCTHCEEQKEMFGPSFQYIPYVECGVKGSRTETPECVQAGVKNFPTWEFADGSRSEGTKSFAYLSDKTGCHLP
jgi:hypothetical protein